MSAARTPQRERGAARPAGVPCAPVLGAVLAAMLVLLLGGVGAARAQTPFAVEAVSVRGASQHLTRVDLYAHVPYDQLRFLRTGSDFTAQYTMTVEAYRLGRDSERRYLADRQIWERSVEAATFEATRSGQRSDRWMRSLQLRPGPYELAVRLEDPVTNQVVRRTLTTEVRDVRAPVAVSDLVVLEDFSAEAGTITPRIEAEVNAGAGSLSLFYELYADAPRTVRVVHEILRTPQSDGVPVLSALLRLGREEGEAAQREAAYTRVRPRTLARGRTPAVVTLPIADAEVGEYLVRVRVETRAGEVLAAAEKRVTLRWNGLVAHMRDIDDAIDQLGYIAKDDDLEHIRAGRTEAERMQRLEAFWDKRDPTPSTERNERMEEYYYRVARANRDYSQRARDLVAGWETDRGHVLVLFGEPDAVERHPQSASARPYEVWHYERIGRRFIFVDQGRGQYQLLEPVWDERTRIR